MKPVSIGCKGMAKDQKQQLPPAHIIEAPQSLAPLMQAFHVDSDKVAKSLISDAARAIYGKGDYYGRDQVFSKSELDGIVSLMKCIRPMDSLETLFAAQIIVGHMLGMRKLAESCHDDQRLGLNLLRFSNESMQQLNKKRNGATQNIVVNYNHHGQGNTLMQTVLAKGEG
jgi:hypothetical protein